jgi:hypothetical protein
MVYGRKNIRYNISKILFNLWETRRRVYMFFLFFFGKNKFEDRKNSGMKYMIILFL